MWCGRPAHPLGRDVAAGQSRHSGGRADTRLLRRPGRGRTVVSAGRLLPRGDVHGCPDVRDPAGADSLDEAAGAAWSGAIRRTRAPCVATRRLSAGDGDRRSPAEPPGSRLDTVAIAKGLLAQSVLRQQLFDGEFRQPSWDMLLCLYVAGHRQQEMTEAALCARAAEPPAQGRLRLFEMERHGLVRRRDYAPDPIIEVTADAAARLERLLADLAECMRSAVRRPPESRDGTRPGFTPGQGNYSESD